MFTKLTDTSQATIYPVLVLVMATGVALLIRFLELAPNMIYTGSVWPASLAHAVHNAAWGALGAFTATTTP